MKHKHWLQLCGCVLLLHPFMASGSIVPDRYAGIARENAFRLSPPKPVASEVIQPLERPRITLQGVTTILGRAQVLLDIQAPSKSTLMVRRSCILAQGESQDEIVVSEVNVRTGTVRITNLGSEQTLTLDR